MTLHLKRAYEPTSGSDGERYLVDRLWPRGVTKEKAHLTGWLKDLAPSSELRVWYGHKVERWPEFQQRYLAELGNPAAQTTIDMLREKSEHQPVTLITASRDVEHSEATVLQQVIEGKLP